MRHVLSTGLAAYPGNSNGVPFDMSHIYASGNLSGDMYCNVAAEATGRTLACRLYNATDDSGMNEMLAFNIARDTMHQEQWLAVLEELGPSHLPIPNSFPQSQENKDFNYSFLITTMQGWATKRTRHGQPVKPLMARASSTSSWRPRSGKCRIWASVARTPLDRRNSQMGLRQLSQSREGQCGTANTKLSSGRN